VESVVRPRADDWRLDGLRGNLREHIADVRDAEAVAGAVKRAKPEWVFNLATYGAYPTQTEVGRIFDTNLSGTVNLLEACLALGVEAFVNSGSSSEYGYKDHAPSESEPLEPNSEYAVAKAGASMYCRHAARSHDAHVVTLRLYSAYGPWEEPARFVPTLLARGLEQELPPLVNPDVARDFVYVDDVVDAFLLAAGASTGERGAIYNVGTGTQTTIGEAVEVARRLLEIEAEPKWGSMKDRRWDTTTWVADSSLIRAELGWQPSHDLQAGLAATIAWLRAGGPRERYGRGASAGS
jgi:nucleoside-diphosphate-sugar epimerase